MVRFILLPVCLAFAADLRADVPQAVLEAEQARIAIVEQVAPSVVCIFGRDGGGGGSGVLISPDGFALTNFHVTSGAGDFMKCGLNDGQLYDAVIVGIDPTGDVALIQLLGRDDFPVAPLGDSDELRVGEWVYVMGNPFLLAADFTPTVTYGIVSGLNRYQYPAGTFLEYTDCIQFDTSLNPGNSGGPLFNERGEVVGINGRGSFEKRGRVNVGAGYAISINQVKYFLDHLRSGRVVDHGTIGATVATGPDGAVRVASILEDSDAYRRGLRLGDEIVTFAGRPIRSANQFQNVLGIHPSGWTLPLTYRRGAETSDILVRLSNAHRESELLQFSQTPPDQENPQPGRRPGRPPEREEGERRDGGPPKDERPERGPRREGERPRGLLPPPHAAAPDVPEDLKALLVKKPGFANYRYNEIEQRRVLEALKGGEAFRRSEAGIVLTGPTGDGKPFRLTITDRGVGLEAGRNYVQQLEEEHELIDEPPGSGGFLAGVHVFRQVLLGRQQRLADFYYYGSEPLDGIGPLVDVLIVKERGGTLRLLVRRDEGRLAGFDFWITDGADDCRVRFGDRESADGVPAEWRVHHANEEILKLTVEKAEPLRKG
jgi:serine protease Do